MATMAIHITGDADADAVLTDSPFALLVGMMLDQQYPMEHAFRGPHKVLTRFGSIEPAAIAAADPEEFATLCSTPPAIHRYGRSMAARLQSLAQLVEEKYDGDAARIWNDATSGQELLDRFGNLDPAAIAAADPEEFATLCLTPPAIHRYGRSMAGRLQELARVVVDEYDGDASRIWSDAKSGKTLFGRLKALPGFGDQKAKIFAALLAKQLDVKPRGWTTVTGDYGRKGFRSVADVVDPESLAKVREFKQAAKKKAKAADEKAKPSA